MRVNLSSQSDSKLGMGVVVFSSSESKVQKAFDFGVSGFHITSEVEKFGGMPKVDILIATAHIIPNLSL
jgi:hypothetical protein